EGRFTMNVSTASPMLIVSFIGFSTQYVPVSGTVVEVQLIAESTTLDDIVVIGYGSTRSKDLTGSVATVDLGKTRSQPVSDIGQAIQGRAAGVQVYTSGEPGGNVTFRVRGTGTIANNNPLIVVDGMPLNGGLNQLNMSDVESISVLKDASSTAIYGARGANGVVIV